MMAEECTVVRFTGEASAVRIETLKSSSGSGVRSGGGEGSSKIPENNQVFGPFYMICVSLSVLTYIIDLTLATVLLYYYCLYGLGAYFAVTLTFVLVPALFMTAFNLRWYIVDHDDPSLGKISTCQWVLRIVFLLLQISPLLRYIDTFYYGIKSVVARYGGSDHGQTTYYRRMLDEDTNGALLRLFHCFLHAGPQCVIQLMILLKTIASNDEVDKKTDLTIVQAWTVLASLISIAWSLTTYHRSVRYARDDKEKMTWEGTTIAFCWHFMSAISRVVALSLLAAIYPSWMGIVCILHWGVMSLWLAFEHLTTSCPNRCEELLLSMALGLAYVLAFISPRDGPTRYVYLAYYLVCFMENTAALVVWCVTNNSLDNPLLYYGSVITQIVTFLLAIVFLLIYYRYCHPSVVEQKNVIACTSKSGLSKSYNLRSYS